ncbi:hypothetical protein SELMODRAFT_414951 [Selaginella moellendorffii]|uniref:Uncharacterized protein n=1 Tax=Selaginella moellendorffii TaxID=88036 RepID=D8RU41_SELML|nr:hypothetical protein SELMODRAFT_414951 [Selaginella moellendorffii]
MDGWDVNVIESVSGSSIDTYHFMQSRNHIIYCWDVIFDWPRTQIWIEGDPCLISGHFGHRTAKEELQEQHGACNQPELDCACSLPFHLKKAWTGLHWGTVVVQRQRLALKATSWNRGLERFSSGRQAGSGYASQVLGKRSSALFNAAKPEDKSAYWSSNSAFKRRAGGVVCITEIQHEEVLKVEDLEQRISVQIDYLDTTTPVARFGRTGVNVRSGEASTRSARPDAAQHAHCFEMLRRPDMEER